MKKIIALAVTLLLVLTAVTGCGSAGSGTGSASSSGTASGSAADEASFKTIGDLLKFECCGYVYDDSKYKAVFNDNGVYYYVEADISKEKSAALNELSWDDPDHDQKLNDLLQDIEVTKTENLNDQILPEEELEKLIGKAGEDLLNAGWEALYFYDPGKSAFMEYGPFQYLVSFSGDYDASDEDDTVKAIQSLIVEAVEFSGVGNSLLN